MAEETLDRARGRHPLERRLDPARVALVDLQRVEADQVPTRCVEQEAEDLVEERAHRQSLAAPAQSAEEALEVRKDPCAAEIAGERRESSLWVEDGASRRSTYLSIAVLDVETLQLSPLDSGGRQWPHRPGLFTEKPVGLHHHPGHRPAPMPSPTGGGAPRLLRFTASSGSTWRPTSPWPTSPTPRATAYRITWKRSSGPTTRHRPSPAVQMGRPPGSNR